MSARRPGSGSLELTRPSLSAISGRRVRPARWEPQAGPFRTELCTSDRARTRPLLHAEQTASQCRPRATKPAPRAASPVSFELPRHSAKQYAVSSMWQKKALLLEQVGRIRHLGRPHPRRFPHPSAAGAEASTVACLITSPPQQQKKAPDARAILCILLRRAPRRAAE